MDKKGIVIAVWGNSGISSLAGILAKELCHRFKKENKQAVVINNNRIVPMQPLWHPLTSVEQGKSIGLLLKKPSINTFTIAKSMEVYKSFPQIGTIGYCDGNNVITDIETAQYSHYVDLIETARNIVDFVLIDCCQSVENILTLAALEMSNVTIVALTPDIKGVNFYRTNLNLLPTEKFDNSKYLFIANMSMSYHDIATFEKNSTKVFATLPFLTSIYEENIHNSVFELNKALNMKYKLNLNKVIKEFLNEKTETTSNTNTKKITNAITPL